MTQAEIREMIKREVEATYAKAEENFGTTFDRARIQYKLTGMCAGMFIYKRNSRTGEIFGTRLNFNVEFAMFNQDDLHDTIIHEVAHHVARIHYGQIQPHGQEWWSTYRALGGKSNSHKYSNDCVQPPSYYRRRPYVYTCGCTEFRITTVIHKRMAKGQVRRCSSCNGRLEFVKHSPSAPEAVEEILRAAKTVEKPVESTELEKLQKSLKPRSKTAPVQDASTEYTRPEAKEKGFTWFWTGRPCRHGHTSARNTSNGICRECWDMFKAGKMDKDLMDKEL